MLWFWIDFVWFGAHQLSVKLARSTRCELCDAISYIGLLWFLRIWFKLFLILKNFDGLYICKFNFIYFTSKFCDFLQIVLLIPNSTWRTLLAISINYKADLLTNSISIETSPNDHHTPLVQWSLHKFKYLWGVRGKGRGSNLQEEASHTYTLRLG